MSYLVHRVMDSPKDGQQTDGQPEGQMDNAGHCLRRTVPLVRGGADLSCPKKNGIIAQKIQYIRPKYHELCPNLPEKS